MFGFFLGGIKDLDGQSEVKDGKKDRKMRKGMIKCANSVAQALWGIPASKSVLGCCFWGGPQDKPTVLFMDYR